MLRIAILGCGRIGQMHAANVARHPRVELAMVYDVFAPAADKVAQTLASLPPKARKPCFPMRRSMPS